MCRAISYGTTGFLIPAVSISTVDLFTSLTLAPISYKIRIIIETSLMLGIFSMTHGPSAKMVAGIIATAAFFGAADFDLACEPVSAVNHIFFQGDTLPKLFQ